KQLRREAEVRKTLGQRNISCCPRASQAAPVSRTPWRASIDANATGIAAVALSPGGDPGASPLTALAGKKRSPSPARDCAPSANDGHMEHKGENSKAHGRFAPHASTARA